MSLGRYLVSGSVGFLTCFSMNVLGYAETMEEKVDFLESHEKLGICSLEEGCIRKCRNTLGIVKNIKYSLPVILGGAYSVGVNILATEAKVISQTSQYFHLLREVRDDIIFNFGFHEPSFPQSFAGIRFCLISNPKSSFEVIPRHDGNSSRSDGETLPVFPGMIPDLGVRRYTHTFGDNCLFDPGMATYNHVFHDDRFLYRRPALNKNII